MLWGQHVSLADARHWVLDPADPLLKDFPQKVWRVSGFITETGDNGKLREFLMSSAERSLAAKRKYTDELGMITAAFYEPVLRTGQRSGGTEPGNEKSEPTKENDKYTPGKLRAVVNIHYVDADDPKSTEALEAIQAAPAPTPSGPRS
jgi:hypothetical protein